MVAATAEGFELSTDTVADLYMRVFNRQPAITTTRLPNGAGAIIVSEWLWLFPSGIEDRWVIRIAAPKTIAFFRRYPCLSRRHNQEIEKPSLQDAFLYAAELEAHRLGHLAIEGF